MTDAPLILFDAEGSPCARRVKICLHEKNLSYETRQLDLSRMDQKRADYLALNPNGVVPTLLHGSFAVFESSAIIQYLDDIFPDTRFGPASASELAAIRSWQARELDMAKTFRPLMYQRLAGPVLRMTKSLEEALEAARANGAEADQLAWEEKVWRLNMLTPEEEEKTERALRDWLSELEDYLERHSYLIGDRFSLADASVMPRVRMMPFIQIPLAPKFPAINDWIQRINTRPSVVATQSVAEEKMAKLAVTPILPAAKRRYAPGGNASFADRLIVSAARPVLRRAISQGARNVAPFQVSDRDSLTSPEDASIARLKADDRSLHDGITEVVVEQQSPWNKTLAKTAERLGIPVRHAKTDTQIKLCYDGKDVTDPMAAIELLSALHPEKAPLGASAQDTARTRMWLALDQGAFPAYASLGLEDGSTYIPKAQALAAIRTRLALIRNRLSVRDQLVGDSETVADFLWRHRVRQLAAAHHFKNDLKDENLTRWIESSSYEVKQRDKFSRIGSSDDA